MTKDVSMNTIWDTSKAVIRGFLIKKSSEAKKKQNKCIQELSEKIQRKELARIKEPHNEKIRKEIFVLQKQLDQISTEEIVRKLKYTKQKYFEFGNKAGKFLAYKVKKKKEGTLVTELQDETGVHTDQGKIKQIFHLFYKNLYQEKKEKEIHGGKIKKFLEKIKVNKNRN